MGPLQEYAKKLLIYSTLTFDPPWTGLYAEQYLTIAQLQFVARHPCEGPTLC